VKEELGDLNIIAEDLGFMTDEVIELRESTGFPGMKILQFAFNPDDESIDSPHLAPNNSVMYTGTHDNNTVLGWYRNEIDDPTREYLARYKRVRICTACDASYRLCFRQLHGDCYDARLA